MSTAAEQIIDQMRCLVDAARLRPADECAKLLERAATMAQAAQAEVLVAAERSGELKDSGTRTVRSFTATILRRSPEDASAYARVALHLVCFPRLAAAYRSGLVHSANVRAVTKHLPTCGLALLQHYEPQLLELCLRCGPKEIHDFCRQVVEVHKPDDDADKVQAQGSRMVRISRVGDLAHLDAMLDPVVADQLKAHLAAMTKATRDPANSTPYGERSADALEAVLAAGMNAPEGPKRSRRRSHATVSVQLETLLGMPDHGRALLARFGLIPTSTAARLSCDAIVRMVVEHGDQVLNVGRTARVVSDVQYAALAAMYTCCVVPGCAVRFADCEIHHLWWWSQGGPTDLNLQVPVCRAHHQWLHEGGYSITRDQGVLVFRDPTGRVIGNIDQALTEQLDLLRQQQPPPDEPSADLAGRTLRDIGGRPDSDYRHGAWGWDGLRPSPPPRHAPPAETVSA